jgi:hypothetical protein
MKTKKIMIHMCILQNEEGSDQQSKHHNKVIETRRALDKQIELKQKQAAAAAAEKHKEEQEQHWTSRQEKKRDEPPNLRRRSNVKYSKTLCNVPRRNKSD